MDVSCPTIALVTSNSPRTTADSSCLAQTTTSIVNAKELSLSPRLRASVVLADHPPSPSLL
jgi:hypothetical protein